MYDLKDSIELIMPTADGDKICEVRQPTENEWTDRFNKRYTIIRNLDRGTTEQKPMNREAADLALLQCIQLNKDVVFDDAEAVTLMDQLANCDLVDIVRTNGRFSVTLNTILGEVVHTVNIPLHKDLKFATEASVKVQGSRGNSSTIRINLKPTGELYDKVAESVEGYSTDIPKEVPIVHKHAVINAVQGEISNIAAKSKSRSGEQHPMSPGPSTQV